MKINGYSNSELTLAIRQERITLVKERIELVRHLKRLTEVDRRLGELERAEYLLENGFG